MGPLLLALLACDGAPPSDSGARETAPDTGTDTVVDTEPDTAPDTDTAADTDTGVDTGADTDTEPLPPPPRIVWGDLHSHTNLSPDGCEAPERRCMPDHDLPGEGTFPRARARGLGFVALTDHAEFSTYARPGEEVALDTWEHTRESVLSVEGTDLFGVMGYEWTSMCEIADEDPGYRQVHRTVLIEATDACAAWRIPACRGVGELVLGNESYGYSTLEPAVLPSDLLARLREAPTLDGCGPSRWVAYFHHAAQARPASVDWSDPNSRVEGDTVVEIASEHGSSECDTRVAAEGCDWRLNEEQHRDDGSIQYMLQQGIHLGFVGGTDNHMDEPGQTRAGAGKVRDVGAPTAQEPWHEQFAEGTVTGVLTDEATFDRADLFDALAARRTVVASWPARDLVVYAIGADRVRYLPGADVPVSAMPLALTVSLADPEVTSWTAELVDPFGQLSDATTIDLPAGEIRYLRIRAFLGDEEHRIFASPFFVQ